MNRLRHILRDERGTFLADAMVGVVVMAVAIGGFATVTAAAAQSLTVSQSQTQRTSYVHSATSDASSDPGSVPTTPRTTSVIVAGQIAQLTQWSTLGGKTVTVNAAITRTPATAATACSIPLNITATNCIVSTITLPINTSPTITTTPLPGTWSSKPAATSAGASVSTSTIASITTSGYTQIRYVINVSNVTTAGFLTFTDAATGSVLLGIPISTSTNQYFFGSINIPTTTTTVNFLITGVATISQMYVYAPPTGS